MKEIKAFKRADGRVGIRNSVLVISMVSCSNIVTEQIARSTGVVPIVHEQGCTEFEHDHERTRLALIAAGRNPNVGAVLLVGLGCEQTNIGEIRAAIETSGKPVEALLIQDEGGSPEAVAKGISIVEKLKKEIAGIERTSCPVSGLVVGVQCGGSDWTTALSGNSSIGVMTDLVIRDGGSVLMSEVAGFPGSEHIVASRAVNREVGLQVLDMISELRSEYIETYGQKIEEVNPTPGNKAGGITTLVEKSMGNIKKMGTSPVQGVVKLGEQISRPGLWVVDNRAQGPDSFNLTGLAMEGAVITVFSSGRGSPVGNAVMPTLKLTGNPETFKKLASIMDFNSGTIIEGKPIEKVGEELYELLLEIASGKETKSEINGNFEYTIPRESARKRSSVRCPRG
jgi:altronate dehydratase large subunit